MTQYPSHSYSNLSRGKILLAALLEIAWDHLTTCTRGLSIFCLCQEGLTWFDQTDDWRVTRHGGRPKL